MKANIHRPTILAQEKGLAAILITITLMIVLGLISLGIYEVSDRSISESLDSQLSIQAGYAAESGVNDAVTAIKNGGTIPAPNAQNCLTFITANNLNNIISTSPKIAYTCLTINTTPGNLQVSVNQTTSAVVSVSPSAPTQSLTFTWPASEPGSVNNCNQLTLELVPQPDWDCPFPILRVDLFNNVSAGNYSNSQALENDTDTFFFFPTDVSTGTSPVTFGTSSIPTILAASCSSSMCTETLTNLTPIFTNGYARLTSVYGDAGTVTVAADPGLDFIGSQIELDSTGIDQTVVQRIDVRVNLSTNIASPGVAPKYAIDAGNFLCKRYQLYGPGSTAVPAVNSPWDGDNTAPLCGNALKPAIYLYPTHPELVNVKLSYPTGLEASIPSYNSSNGWSVIATPTSSLTNLADGKNYPYLYWEGNTDSFNFNMSQGFVVPGKDTASFLNNELTTIGLNKTEIAGFIQYWVPRMESNPYSLIHFAGSDYSSMAPLDITPKPDAVLRVFMAEEPIAHPVTVTPQHFTPFQRTGFTVVEWGGTILNAES